MQFAICRSQCSLQCCRPDLVWHTTSQELGPNLTFLDAIGTSWYKDFDKLQQGVLELKEGELTVLNDAGQPLANRLQVRFMLV